MRMEARHPYGLLVTISLIAIGACAAPEASAQSDAYCRRVTAEAESQAFLLLSPRLSVQGLHVPNVGGTSGMGIVQGQEWQVRGGLSLSVIDMVRGAYVLDAARSECARHEARDGLQRTLSLGDDFGKLAALRAQLDYLEAQGPALDALLEEAQRSRDEQLLTMAQLHALRLRAAAIQRRSLEARAQINRLQGDAEDRQDTGRPIEAQLAAYEATSTSLAEQRSDIRRLNAWQLNVRGGVVPLDPFDWFGAVELSYNLGGIAQTFAEDAAVDARRDEIREADHEMRRQVERFERIMSQSAQALTDALSLLDAQMELVDQQIELLERLAGETVEARQSLRLARMNRIDLEAERVFRRRLLAEREAVSGDTNE